MSRPLLLLEWFFLFIQIPVILWMDIITIRPLWLLPIPVIYCLIIHYTTKMEGSEAAPKQAYINALLQALPILLVLIVCAYLISPERFFEILLKRPVFWVLILVLYPLISALPHEFIYRQFYFERYNDLFKNHNLTTWSSALVFSWLHIFYHHWVAITFTLAGGILFAQSYQRTRSLRLVWLQHSIYGAWIFTVGLGYYFLRQ